MPTAAIDPLAELHELVTYGLCDGGGIGLPRLRDAVKSMPEADLADYDEVIIESVILDDLVPSVFADDESQPLSHWWWHLGKIRAKTFPAEQLPDALRAIYLETAKNAI